VVIEHAPINNRRRFRRGALFGRPGSAMSHAELRFSIHNLRFSARCIHPCAPVPDKKSLAAAMIRQAVV